MFRPMRKQLSHRLGSMFKLVQEVESQAQGHARDITSKAEERMKQTEDKANDFVSAFQSQHQKDLSSMRAEHQAMIGQIQQVAVMLVKICHSD